MKSINDTQVGGDHYVKKSIQPWAAMESWMSREAFSGYLQGNAIKYLCRHREKGGVADLEKAKHYIEKLIEISAAAEPASPFPKIDDFALRGYDESDMRSGGTD